MAGGPADGDGDRLVDLEAIESLSLADALALVGEPTRADIIIELGNARSIDPDTPQAMSYSELMAKVGVEDSGRFNYHLGQLVGPFVKKREDGYLLRLPGQLVYEAIVAGTLTDRQTIEPFPVGDCPRCPGSLSAAYHPDHLLTVECTDCATLYDAIHLPARALEARTTEEILDVAYQRRFHKVATMRRGACPRCGAVVERALTTAASITYGPDAMDTETGDGFYATMECRACNTSLVGHPAIIAVTLPLVVGFFAEHGCDPARSNWWDEPIAGAQVGTVLLDPDAPTVSVPFRIDDDRLVVVLDSDLQRTDSERSHE